jgi:transposase
MKAYSKDLRKKIVDAIQRGMSKAEAARTFGVGISTVKRYVSKAQRGEPLEPGKVPGKPPIIDQRARNLLEENLKDRPFARLSDRCDYLQAVAGVRVSRSTVCRSLRACANRSWSAMKSKLQSRSTFPNDRATRAFLGADTLPIGAASKADGANPSKGGEAPQSETSS